jgi:hypothetical protein
LLEVELKRQPLELYEEQMRKPPTGDNGSEFTAPLLAFRIPPQIAQVLQIVPTRDQIEWANRRYIHAGRCNANRGT